MKTMQRTGLITAAIVVVVAGCTYQDTDAPEAPLLETRSGTVRTATVTIRGWAEPGSTVTISRTPAFASPVRDTHASDYTGAFAFADVPVQAGEVNTFTFVAIDLAGNEGEAATLEFTLDERPLAVRAQLVRSRVVAGAEGPNGVLEVSAIIDGDEGFPVADRALAFTMAGVANETKTSTTDGSGRASAVFEGLTTPGVGSVVVSFGTGEGATRSDPLGFEVVAGPAATLQLQLRRVGGGDAATNLTLAAGEAAEAVVVAKDGSGNTLAVPVQLSTNAPGAAVEGMRLTGLTRVGTYTVVAAVTGVPTANGGGLHATANVTVTAGEAGRVVLEAPATARAGESFPFAARLEDAFGNAVAVPTTRQLVVTTKPEADATIDLDARIATLRRAGPQTLTASLTGGDTPAAATVTVFVSPADPAEVEVALSGVDEEPATPDVLDLTASASATLEVTTTVRDAFGNPVSAAVALSTDAPALFDGTTLRKLTSAGDWEVRATVPGTLAAGRAQYRVVAASPAQIRLSLGRSLAEAGTPVPFTTLVTDAFGNPTIDAVELVVNALPGADVTVDADASTLVVRRAGDHTVTARSARSGSAVTGDSRPLAIRAGAPASVTVEVPGPNDVRAGEQPALTVAVSDAFGNPVVPPPVTVAIVPQGETAIVAPGPVASGGRIYNLVKAGTYLVVAQVTGTDLANDTDEPEATIRVAAARASSVKLSLERTTVEAGLPVRFSVSVRDAWDNEAAATTMVGVRQGTTVLANALGGNAWVAPGPGSYELFATATPTGGGASLTDVAAFEVVPTPDHEGPAITFLRPAGNPTIPSLPAPGAVSPNGCASEEGDLIGVTIADPSKVAQYWFTYGGLVTSQPADGTLPAIGIPPPSLTLEVPLCASQIAAATRGELLVRVAAADIRGNYREASASFCLDPDAGHYLPTAGTAERCSVVRDAAGLANVRSIAANRTGDLALAMAGTNDVRVALFGRSEGRPYGLGAVHTLSPASATAPGGIAVGGSTVFTPVVDGARTLIVRSRLATTAADDEFLALASMPDARVTGVALSADGGLFVATGDRGTDGGASLFKLDGAFDYGRRHTSLPAPLVTSASARIARVCEGLTPDELYATGYASAGTNAAAALWRIDLAAPTVSLHPVWTDETPGRTIGDCAVTEGGVAVSLGSADAPSIVLVDLAAPTQAPTPMLTHFATGSTIGTPVGVARAGTSLFAATADAAGGSLVRFARGGDGF